MSSLSALSLSVVRVEHWSKINADDWPWKNFSPEEMACQGTGKLLVNVRFMNKLQRIRGAYGKPITIVSGYRSAEHNAAVSKKKSRTGAHTFGRAVDISIAARERDVPLLMAIAWRNGMTRCGLQLTSRRFRMHLDDMTKKDGFAVREDGKGLFCWTY